MDRLALFLAQGLGSGWAPWAPGTWGSVVGVAWFALLLLPGDPWIFVLGGVVGVAIAVWACGSAEVTLRAHDPGSIVLDEIVAVPWCFAVPLLAQTRTTGFPDLQAFVQGWPWWTLLAGFAAFRLFDIWKPWPVRTSQHLPGGWGVVTDDLLAALWVNAVAVLLVV